MTEKEWEEYMQSVLFQATLPQFEALVPKVFEATDNINQMRKKHDSERLLKSLNIDSMISSIQKSMPVKTQKAVFNSKNSLPTELMHVNNYNNSNLVNENTQIQEKFTAEIHKNDYLSNNSVIQKASQISSNIKNNVKEKIDKFNNKYEGLNNIEKIQKIGSKIKTESPYIQYYGLSSKFKDNDQLDSITKKQNDFYTVKDIEDLELQNQFIQKASQIHKLDSKNPENYDKIMNTKVVIPKENSKLHNRVKNSEITQNWIIDNYKKIQNNEKFDTDIQYPANGLSTSELRDLYLTIHNANISNPKINNDGSLNFNLNDIYDFETIAPKDKSNWKNIIDNTLIQINNRAKKQQDANQLENYILSVPIKYSKEDLEKMRKKYKK